MRRFMRVFSLLVLATVIMTAAPVAYLFVVADPVYLVNEDFTEYQNGNVPPSTDGWTFTPGTGNSVSVQDGQLLLNRAASAGVQANFSFPDITGTNVVVEYKFTLGNIIPSASYIFPILTDTTTSTNALQGMIFGSGFLFNGKNMNSGNSSMMAYPNTTYFVRLTLNFTTHKYDAYVKNLFDGNSNTITAIGFSSASNDKINQMQININGSGTPTPVKFDYFRIYDGTDGLSEIPQESVTGKNLNLDFTGFPNTNYADSSSNNGNEYGLNITEKINQKIQITNEALNFTSNGTNTEGYPGVMINMPAAKGNNVIFKFTAKMGSAIPNNAYVFGTPMDRDSNNKPFQMQLAGNRLTVAGKTNIIYDNLMWPNNEYSFQFKIDYTSQTFDYYITNLTTGDGISSKGVEFASNALKMSYIWFITDSTVPASYSIDNLQVFDGNVIQETVSPVKAINETFGNYTDGSVPGNEDRWTISSNQYNSAAVQGGKLVFTSTAQDSTASQLSATRQFAYVTGNDVVAKYELEIGNTGPNNTIIFPSFNPGDTLDTPVQIQLLGGQFWILDGTAGSPFKYNFVNGHKYYFKYKLKYTDQKYDLRVYDITAGSDVLNFTDHVFMKPVQGVDRLRFWFNSSAPGSVSIDNIQVYNESDFPDETDPIPSPSPSPSATPSSSATPSPSPSATPSPSPSPDSNIIIYDTFDKTDGYLPTQEADGWQGCVNTTSKASVIDGGRLKLYMDRNQTMRIFRYLPQAITSGKVVVKYTMDIQANGEYNLCFPALGSSTGTLDAVVQHQLAGTNIARVNHTGSDTDTTAVQTNTGYTIQDGHKYEFVFVLDMSASTYSYRIADLTQPNVPIKSESDIVGKYLNYPQFNRIDLFLGADANNTELIYLDDLVVYNYQPLAVSACLGDGTAITDGAVDVPVNSSIKLNFNQFINASTVSGITLSGSPNMQIGVDSNGSTVTLLFPDGLEYNKSYTLTVPLTVQDETGQSLAQPYTISFTTQKEPEKMIDISDPVFTDLNDLPISGLQNGGSIKASVSVTNHATVASGNRNIILILVIKDKQNKVIDINYVNTTVRFGETISISNGFELPSNVADMRCELYAWDNLPGKAYMSKVTFPSD